MAVIRRYQPRHSVKKGSTSAELTSVRNDEQSEVLMTPEQLADPTLSEILPAA